MSDEDKQIVEEELRMQYRYDELIDNNPLVAVSRPIWAC